MTARTKKPPQLPKRVRPERAHTAKPENATQLACFEDWFKLGRDTNALREISQKHVVIERTLYDWMVRYQWWPRANKRLEEARKKADADAVSSTAKFLKSQQQAGELLRQRGVEFFANNKVKDERNAVTAIKVGVDLERQAIGLPSDVGQQQINIDVNNKVDINEAALLAAMERLLDARNAGSATPEGGQVEGAPAPAD